jgi:hypothetical protein
LLLLGSLRFHPSASESGTTAELLVFLTLAAGASVVSVPKLHSYSDRIHSSVQLRPHLLTGTPFSTDLSASYSELTGQPTPSQTTVLTTTKMSVSETVAPLVTRTGTTEIVPSSVASTDPPTIGTLQAQVTETAALVATTS